MSSKEFLSKIRGSSVKTLLEIVSRQNDELLAARVKHGFKSGKEVNSLRRTKKEIAQVKTVINEKIAEQAIRGK